MWRDLLGHFSGACRRSRLLSRVDDTNMCGMSESCRPQQRPIKRCRVLKLWSVWHHFVTTA